MTTDRQFGSRPAQGRSLVIRGERCGWLTPAAAAALGELPEALLRAFHFAKDEVTLTLPEDNREACDFLATLASTLYEKDKLPDWRGELLDVLNEKDEPSGLVLERSAFRLLGLVTRAVYAVAATPEGWYWLGCRSEKKRIDPHLFDTLASGLISAGETPDEAVRRETAEEAGLEEPDVTFESTPVVYRISRPVPEGWMNEVTYAYRGKTAAGVKPFPEDGEVERFVCADVKMLFAMQMAGLLTYETQAALQSLQLL